MRPVTSLEELLAAHPWPAEYAALPRKEWLWHFEVPLALDVLWPKIADTSRMNRALGVSEMTFVDEGPVRIGTNRPLGLTQRWTEVPWNWVAGRWIESVRVYEKGFSKVVYGIFELTPLSETSTRVAVYFGAVPRGLLGGLVLSLGFPRLEQDFARVFGGMAARLNALQAAYDLPGPAPLPAEAEAKLTASRAALVAKKLDAALVDRLLAWLRTGDEDDLYRIQIRAQARAWGVDEHELLRVALHATREGVLEVSWDVICPHCRGVSNEVASPDGLTKEGSCGVCEVTFGTDNPESIEITFHVHPSIRPIAHRTFCSAEPARKDHIRVQLDVPAGQTKTVEARLEPGTYRLRLHGREDYGFLDAAEGGDEAVTWRAGALGELKSSTRPRLELVNDTDTSQRFVLERSRWSDHALRPGQLFSLQDYRDLFSEDYLASDVQLAIGQQTILFTDIVGSTAMYEEQGDPKAFMRVKKHFEAVFPIVGEHQGAVVKTIGDAVMAAFNDPLDALKACADIHARFGPGHPETATRLRISLNTGPCIAVKLNTGVDYFGQTVNLAAKLQALAGAGQVALSQAVLEGPGVKDFLEGKDVATATYESKALRAPVAVTQWTCFRE